MANSKITITVNGPFVFGDFIAFNATNNNTAAIKEIRETYQTVRLTNKQIPLIDGFTDDVFLSEADKFAFWFNIDYNGLNGYNVVVNGNTVEVTSNYNNITFSDITSQGNISAVIENTEVKTPFELTTHEAISAPNSCEFVRFSFLANKIITGYIIDNVGFLNNSTSLEVDYPRGSEFKIKLSDGEGGDIFYPTETKASLLTDDSALITVKFDLLLSANISVTYQTLINGNTIIINVENTENLVLEYSLDNTNWQAENIFVGQSEGNYTAYVRDQFGCVALKPFEVLSISGTNPYFKIPKSIPFDFIKQEDVDNKTVFKNETNSFEKDGFNEIKYVLPTLFQKTDTPFLQIKSNYKTLELILRSSSGKQTALTLDKKTNNLNRYLKLDGIIHKNTGTGLLSVYFNSGNVYNEINDVVNQHSLEGNLPAFAKINNYITIEDIGTFKIKSVFLDSTINKKVILVDYPYDGIDTSKKIESIYNLLDFEVYQTQLNFSGLTDGLYDLIVKATPVNGDEEIYISQNIDIKEYHENTLLLKYYNNSNNNRDIFYKFNVVNELRVEYTSIKKYFSKESSININDDNVKPISYMVVPGDEILFEDLTTKQLETLVLALAHENLFINNIGYAQNSDSETENVENTNLYSLTAKLLKTNEVYSTKQTGDSGTDEILEKMYVPKLLSDNTEFIRL